LHHLLLLMSLLEVMPLLLLKSFLQPPPLAWTQPPPQICGRDWPSHCSSGTRAAATATAADAAVAHSLTSELVIDADDIMEQYKK